MQRTTAPQSFKKSSTNEVWATFPSHTNNPDCVFVFLFFFWCRDISFCTAFLFSCVKKIFQREATLIIQCFGHPFVNADQLRMWRMCVCVCGGGLMCVSKLSHRKRPKRLFSLLSSNLAQAQRESFYLSWHSEDSLKEPYVSSALSQQQSQDHHALLFYHAEIQTSGRQTDS